MFEEMMSEKFPNLKETDMKIQEVQRAPNKVNSNRPTPKHKKNISKMMTLSNHSQLKEQENSFMRELTMKQTSAF